MSDALNQDLFPFCDGEVLSKEAEGPNFSLKRSLAHACFEINRLIRQLKNSNQNQKKSLLNDLAQASEARENLINQFNKAGLDVEMEIEGLMVSNLIFKPIVLDESQLSPEDIGHSFDITIPFIEDEKAMSEELHDQLDTLLGNKIPSTDTNTRSNS